MVERPIQQLEWEPLQELDGDTFFDTIDVKEEDAATFPSELILDLREETPVEQRQNIYQKILGMNTPDKFRLAILGNRETRNLLIHDPLKIISLAVLRNPKINEDEAVQYAQRKDLSEDVVLGIAKHPKWKKDYRIKCAVVSNPKTPFSVGLNLLPHLHEKDLKSLTRDKDVPSALRRKAQELLLQRNVK